MQDQLEFRSIRELVNYIIYERFGKWFYANRAHQDETEGYLIWPQLKLSSHEMRIGEKKKETKKKMSIALNQD
jgi:hypothetical protein